MSKISDALSKARMERMKNYQNPVSSSDNLPRTVVRSEIAAMEEKQAISQRELSQLKIIFSGMQQKDILNRFRDLRTTIIQNNPKENLTIQIISIVPGGGSSYVAINLAAAFSLDSAKSALIINCNRHSVPDYEMLVDDPNRGLADYFAGKMDVESIIQPTGMKRLRVVPFGGRDENTAESFSSQIAADLFKELKLRYQDRYIVLDSPPATDSADVKLLHDFVDVVILVVPYGRSNINDVVRSVKVIGTKKLLGVVIDNRPNLFS